MKNKIFPCQFCKKSATTAFHLTKLHDSTGEIKRFTVLSCASCCEKNKDLFDGYNFCLEEKLEKGEDNEKL